MSGARRKVCCLGNSHIAALRSAWDAEAGRWPDLDMRFVGAHKGLLLETTIKDGWLRPETPDAIDAFARLGGGEGVRLADYDALVITGCLVALSLTASVYRRMHWVGLPSVAAHQDLANGPQLLVSRAAALATAQDSLSQRLGPRLIAHLRPNTDNPIFLTSQPRASASLLDSRDPTTKAHRIAHDSGDAPLVSQLHEAAAQQAVEAAGAQYIPQPPETVAHHVVTHEDYMRGATRLAAKLNTPQPPHDIRHANAAYGALVIHQIAKRVSA